MTFMKLIMVAVFVTGSHLCMAQTKFGLEYKSEIQNDFRGGFNFPNLLRLDAEINVGHGFAVEAASISIAKTSKERLVDDLQTFSNIEEDNLPFALAVFGAAFKLADGHSLHVGVRNVNEDYFTSPVTSLFSNSSCGIFPTISCNYPIANYPLSSLSINYLYESDRWHAVASIYNGRGNSCNPADDGIFLISQGEYCNDALKLFWGGCFHSGGANHPSAGSAWAYVEEHVTGGFSIIADYSHAFGAVPCLDFAGLGGRYVYGCAELGLFTDYARFRDNCEWATELTCNISISEHVDIQPALHIIRQNDLRCEVMLLRLSVKL